MAKKALVGFCMDYDAVRRLRFGDTVWLKLAGEIRVVAGVEIRNVCRGPSFK